jgi:UDP-GlcNAc:undecaprenyl-phosphate/decaprenyl-phosphate GlcNAc-1-phosphate transferase
MGESVFIIFAVFLISLALSTAVTWLVCRLARRYRWVPAPVADRLPVSPAPILGGAAMYAAFISSAIANNLFRTPTEIVLFTASTAAFILGLIDDFRTLQPRWKLLGQAIISLALLQLIPAVSITGVKLFDVLIAAVWLVGITNAFNLLDNIHGLSAGIAILVACFESVLFFLAGNTSLALLMLAFAGAVLGFLVFNFPSGRIFMGDSGSLFIGFWLASTALVGANSWGVRHHGASLLFPVLVMVVPICDTTLVTFTRTLRRRSIAAGGTDHLSHRLVAYGLSKPGAVVTLWCLSALAGTVALLTLRYGITSFVSMVAILLAFVAIAGVYLARFELRSHGSTVEMPGYAFRPPQWLGISLGAFCDVVLIVAAYYTSYLLRFDAGVHAPDMLLLEHSLAEVVFIKLAVFTGLGVYRRWWQYFGLRDAFRIAWTSAIASLTAVAYFAAVYRFYGFSRVVFVLDFLVCTFLVLLFRFSFRLFDSYAPANHRANILIYGADDHGETALHLVTKRYPLRVVGFLDPDTAKKNLCIHSVPVRGSLKHLDQLVQQFNIRAVLLTSSATQDERIHLQAKCRTLGIGLMRIRFELEDLVSRGGSFWEDFVPQEHLVELASRDAEDLPRQGLAREAIRVSSFRSPSSKAMP